MASRKRKTKKKATRKKAPTKKATRKKASKRSTADISLMETGIATVFKRNNWEIEIVKGVWNPDYIVLTNKKTYQSYWGVRDDDGAIIFTRPEDIPKYVKEAAVRAYERYLGVPAYLGRNPDGSFPSFYKEAMLGRW